VKAVGFDLKEDRGVRAVEQRRVDEAIYIVRVSNAWCIEQDVFALCASPPCPFETAAGVYGDVDCVEPGIGNELCTGSASV
jgi:hypothetical protein